MLSVVMAHSRSLRSQEVLAGSVAQTRDLTVTLDQPGQDSDVREPVTRSRNRVRAASYARLICTRGRDTWASML